MEHEQPPETTLLARRPAVSSDELRTFLAGQRTLLAWVRTALAMMGFGFLVARFGLFLQQISALRGLPEVPRSGFSLWIGTAMVLLGVAMNFFAAARHVEFLRRFTASELSHPGRSLFEIALSITLGLLGLIMAAYLVLVRV